MIRKKRKKKKEEEEKEDIQTKEGTVGHGESHCSRSRGAQRHARQDYVRLLRERERERVQGRQRERGGKQGGGRNTETMLTVSHSPSAGGGAGVVLGPALFARHRHDACHAGGVPDPPARRVVAQVGAAAVKGHRENEAQVVCDGVGHH